MKRTRSLRALTPAVLGLMTLATTGCLDESPTSPVDPTADAPELPATESLTFPFGFFDQGAAMQRAAGKDHFFNAYVRVVVVHTVVDLMLTPPIAAFGLALHTPPSPQSDGSWIWVYTYVNGGEEAQIRLHGTPLGGERVAWELRVTNRHEVPALDNVVWFEGETGHEGESGFFLFHDPFENGNPVSGRLDWGADSQGDFLRLTDLDDNPNDTLEYREVGTRGSLTFTDASSPDLGWFVKWDEADGTGSLRAPDYNGGVEACWDENQNDTVCAPAL
jgi:hypothetical protein